MVESITTLQRRAWRREVDLVLLAIQKWEAERRKGRLYQADRMMAQILESLRGLELD